MRAKLRETKEELKRRRHLPIPEQGQWLRQVVTGFFAYHAVPTNIEAIAAFRDHVTRLWWQALPLLPVGAAELARDCVKRSAESGEQLRLKRHRRHRVDQSIAHLRHLQLDQLPPARKRCFVHILPRAA
jgi:hypothetical protein